MSGHNFGFDVFLLVVLSFFGWIAYHLHKADKAKNRDSDKQT